MNYSRLQRLVLASGNAGKLREFDALFAPLGIELIPQSQFGVPEAPEPHVTFLENALAKARHASQHTGLPAIADDSGICAEALGGAPGVYSARYAQLARTTEEPRSELTRSDLANNARLIADLLEHTNKRAYYVCVLVLVRSADDPQPIVAEGIWRGEIIATPRGQSGFGYDPHFYLPGLGRTAAELRPEQKNGISHRALALQNLVERLSVAGLA